MQVFLSALGNRWDITEYVNKNIAVNEVIGYKAMNSGVLVIPHVNANALNGIDLSKRIPRMALIEIVNMGKEFKFYVSNSQVEDAQLGRWKHRLELIDLKELLKYRPIPDYAVTQPQGSGTSTVAEISKIDRQEFDLNGAAKSFVFNTSIVSNDSTYIEDRVLKKAGLYTINGSINFIFNSTGKMTGKVSIKAGNTVVGETPFESRGFGYQTININADVTISTATAITVEINGGGTFAEATAVEGFLKIRTAYDVVGKVYFMDQVVEKLLRLHNIAQQNEFVLDTSSKSRLSMIKAYDDMRTEQTLFSALEDIASYVRANLKLDIVEGQKTIIFEFYDELAKVPYVPIKKEKKNELAELNDYTSALALNTNNVVGDNEVNEGWQFLRSIEEKVSQITTENIGVITTFKINKIKKVLVKGKEFRYTDNNIALSASTSIDITDLVVEKAYYDTLSMMSDYNDRNSDNQNNHLYYVRGDNKIYGMSGVGTMVVDWPEIGEANRGLYEAIAYKLTQRSGKAVKSKVDNGAVDDAVMRIYVVYEPFFTSNALIMKDDQTGFEEKIVRRLQANDRVNNAELLGKYAKNTVNGAGGTQTGQSGYGRTFQEYPQKGTVDDENYRVIAISYILNPIENYFSVTKFKDYVFQQPYVGIESDRRLYQVPLEEHITRVDKLSYEVQFSFDPTQIGNNTILSFDKLTNTLDNYPGDKPAYAKLIFDNRTVYTKVVSSAIATTIEWYFEMFDNFNAGFKKIKNGENTFQVGVNYPNIYGQAGNLEVKYYYGTAIVYPNNYPEEVGDGSGYSLSNAFNYQIEKDSREKTALSLQIAYTSYDANIIIYSGIAKFSDLVISENKKRVISAVLNYIPNRDDVYVDYARITTKSISTLFNANQSKMTVSGNNDKGVVYFEEESGELVMAVLGTQQTFEIYIKAK